MEERVKRLSNVIGDNVCRFYCYLKNPISNRRAIGIAEIVGVAIVLVVGAFVLIPGFRAFGTTVLTAINTWWTNTISSRVFPTS